MKKQHKKHRGGCCPCFQLGGTFTVSPDKPLSEQAYIDYATNRINAANRCQHKINASANGKIGGSKKKLKKKLKKSNLKKLSNLRKSKKSNLRKSSKIKKIK